VLEQLPEIADSLVVHLEATDELILFVVPATGLELDEALHARIVAALRAQLSPRHAPDTILAVPAVPRGRTGKKLELPVKRILQGAAPDTVAGRDALTDPDALAPYVAFARFRNR